MQIGSSDATLKVGPEPRYPETLTPTKAPGLDVITALNPDPDVRNLAKVRMLLAKREWVDHIILCSGLVAAHKTDSYLRQLEEAQAEWTATGT